MNEPVSYSVAYTGTGAARSFTVGFEPTFVRIFDVTDGTAAEWDVSMSAGQAFLDSGSAYSLVASGAVTVADRKISLGTDNSVNKASSAYLLWACR